MIILIYNLFGFRKVRGTAEAKRPAELYQILFEITIIVNMAHRNNYLDKNITTTGYILVV